jgi:hypothetical protein
LLLKQRPGVSSDSLIVILSVLRWGLPNGELAVARTMCFCLSGSSDEDCLWYWTHLKFVFWGESVVGGVRFCLMLSGFGRILFWCTAIGADITVCLSQLFGSWVHWWRRVLCCDDVVKTENLDWIFLLDVSFLLRLTCVLDAFSRLLLRQHFVVLRLFVAIPLCFFRACKYFSGYLLHVCRFRYGMLSVACFWGSIFLENLF